MAKKKTNPSDAGGAEAGAEPNTTGDAPVSPYFRKLLKERRDLVKKRSNDEIYKIWLSDHPGYEEVPVKVKQILSNIKSQMRNKKKSGRKRKAKAEVAASNGTVVKVVKTSSTRSLEKLEEMIDDCLSLARSEAPDELEAVIQHLRKARNQVVHKMGL